MRTITDTPALCQALRPWRVQGKRIALVPTMGNLHAGHLHLVEVAKLHAECVVVSIFVNPMQFDRADDLAAYPRTLEEDLSKLEELKVDLTFTPALETIYPLGFEETTSPR